MGAQVHSRRDFTGQPGARPLRHGQQAVIRAQGMGKALELVHIPARLEAETLEQGEVSLLGEDGQVERPRLQNHVVGEVALVHGDEHPVGLAGHLDAGVDDAAIVLFPPSGGEDKQAIAQGIHGFRVFHGTILLHVRGSFFLFPF